MTSTSEARDPRRLYIMTSAWHLDDFGMPPEERRSIFVGPAEALIDDLASAAFGSEWVLDWLKTEGDSVRAGESVATLRSLNGLRTTALPSPADGVLVEIRATRGAVPPRSVMAVIDVRERRPAFLNNVQEQSPALPDDDVWVPDVLHDFIEFRTDTP